MMVFKIVSRCGLPRTIPVGPNIDNNYTSSFGGTSAACPQVAGVAALMLSANPNLSSSDVRRILNGTAIKLPGYTYDMYGWNSEVGYGLVDAYAAVKAANSAKMSITGSQFVCDTEVYTINGIPSNATVSWNLMTTFGQGYGIVSPIGNGASCTVHNFGNDMFEGTLTADVYVSGVCAATVSKKITGDSDFVGFYWDGEPYEDVRENYMMEDDNWITPGSMVLIRSDNLRRKYIQRGRPTDLFSWSNGSYCTSSEYIFECLGYAPGDTLVIKVYGEGSCNVDKFFFGAILHSL